MRLPLVSPSDLSPEQQNLSADMRQGIESNFKGFQAINNDGALIGPWNPWLRFSKFGGPIWELVKALSTSPTAWNLDERLGGPVSCGETDGVFPCRLRIRHGARPCPPAPATPTPLRPTSARSVPARTCLATACACS